VVGLGKFSPQAAKDAKDFEFHPDQKTKRQNDGSLIVRFRAGGALEMCWHLFRWGKEVEVLEPKYLADMLHKHREEWLALR
jgi:predicted DNA-binding transcriptional regulator YafY